MLRQSWPRKGAAALATIATFAVFLLGCGGGEGTGSASTVPAAPTTAENGLDGVVKIDGDRGLYVRCTGSGSPTLVMEGGDGDTSDSYAFAEPSLAKVTRTCVYDRANLGRSDPAPGPRGFRDLVGDLEQLLEAAQIPGPYVLVGTSGGGSITAGYAVAHPQQVAGMVFIDTGSSVSRIRLARSSRRRTRPTQQTSNVATICRSRKTPGRRANASATSPSQSSPSTTRPRRSRSRRSRRSEEECGATSKPREAGSSSARARSRSWRIPVTRWRKTIRIS